MKKKDQPFKKHSIALIVTMIFILFFQAPFSFAAFTISVPSTVTLPTQSVSTAEQSSSNTLNITVNDDRGGSPGWIVTMRSSHVTKIHQAQKLAGNNTTVTSSGSYDGTFGVTSPVKKYVLVITTSGAVGTAQFDVSDAEMQTNSVTGTLVSIGTRGVKANFDTATYQISDQWQILVDSFPYTAMTVTPGTITANSGSLTGVSAGAGGTLSGSGAESNEMTMMSATASNGTGNYTQSISLSLSLHNNSLAGNYSGAMTFTLL